MAKAEKINNGVNIPLSQPVITEKDYQLKKLC